jgi:adenosylcobinamide-GDP ribazoletransferase
MHQTILTDLRGAVAFLTVIPTGWPDTGRPGRTFAYYPLVGLIVGGFVAAAASIRFLPGDVAAFVTLLTWVLVTGGLHLDGFGDACDGLLATVDPARRLEIMKDSRAGSWAVVGLSLLLLGKWITLRHVTPARLILPPVAGRWAMVLAVAGFPYARASGIGGYFRDGFGRTQIVVATVTAGFVAVAFGWPVGLTLLAAPVVVWVVGTWAARRLGGGLTGDVYGALCELTELVCLILLTIDA